MTTYRISSLRLLLVSWCDGNLLSIFLLKQLLCTLYHHRTMQRQLHHDFHLSLFLALRYGKGTHLVASEQPGGGGVEQGCAGI